ncbi:hypothetical protein ACQP2F_33605 [Actinoplanes sp. CA-030573]|uniref:hypothetical protein n=1 Tax=Actinoplanes sp. CA-030573 TaxID=3239898 RepID=UPI003D8A6B8B
MSDVSGTEYRVTAYVRSAADGLDVGQLEDVAAVLKQLLDRVESVIGPDGSSILVDSCWAGVYPGGALIAVGVHALSLEAAEGGVRAIVGEVLQRSEVFSGWTVVRCESGPDEPLAEAALRAAEELGEPPDDVAERADGSSGLSPADEDEEDAWRQRVSGYAPSVRAFDAAVFGDGEDAALAAGALIVASTMFIDELIQDINSLAGHGAAVVFGEGMLFALDDLPTRYARGFDGHFAHRFLVAAIAATGRLSAPQWEPSACLAEALALHIVVQRAGDLLIDHECADEEGARDCYAELEDVVTEGFDLAALYRSDTPLQSSGVPDTDLSSWFEQSSQRALHPFLVGAGGGVGGGVGE